MSNSVYPATPKPFRTIPISSSFPVEEFKTESGRRQVVIHGDGTEEIAWQLQYPALTGAEAATLKAFHRTHVGSGDSFLYDSVEPVASGSEVVRYRVKFGAFNLQHEHKASASANDRRWSLTVELVTVVG